MKRAMRRREISISNPLCVFVRVDGASPDMLPSTWAKAFPHWIVGDGLIAVPVDYIRLGLRGGVNLCTSDIRAQLLPFSGGSLMLSEFPGGKPISGAATEEAALF